MLVLTDQEFAQIGELDNETRSAVREGLEQA
jgi:hypothetical protein